MSNCYNLCGRHCKAFPTKSKVRFSPDSWYNWFNKCFNSFSVMSESYYHLLSLSQSHFLFLSFPSGTETCCTLFHKVVFLVPHYFIV